MEKNYTREQAEEAARRFSSLYNLYTRVCDSEFSPESNMKNYSWFGIFVEKSDRHCVCTVSSEEAFANLRKLAYIIAQTDQDLSQEEPVIENIKDTPGGVREMGEDPNLDPTYANRMLMQASELPGDIPLQDVGQYY